jgi:hypothetical protein
MKYPELINVTVVPTAGYKAIFLSPYSEEDIPEEVSDLWMDHIIGWRISTYQRDNGDIYSTTDAITVDGSSSQDYAVIAPDGTVADSFHSAHANVEEYLAYNRKYQAELKALHVEITGAADGKDA